MPSFACHVAMIRSAAILVVSSGDMACRLSVASSTHVIVLKLEYLVALLDTKHIPRRTSRDVE